MVAWSSSAVVPLDQAIVDLRSAEQMPSWLSTLCVLASVVILVGTIVFAVWRFVANLRLGRAADRAFRGEHTLRPGPAVVKGTVLEDGGDGAPVRIEIDQRGVEEHGSKGSVSHRWTERSRVVRARPFRLRLEDGQELGVEPDERLFLVDNLELTPNKLHKPLAPIRTLVAELSPGEEVYAVGAIEERPDPTAEPMSYRSAPRQLPVLVPPRGQRMLIASERLGRRYRGRAWFHLRWLIFTLLVLTGVEMIPCGGYHLYRWKGKLAFGTVTDKRQHTTGSGKNRRTRHDLWVRLDSAWVTVLDASRGSFRRAESGQRLALLTLGWDHQLGSTPTIHWGGGIAALAIALTWFFLFRHRRRRSRPWYDHPALVHQASGPLDPKTLRT